MIRSRVILIYHTAIRVRNLWTIGQGSLTPRSTRVTRKERLWYVWYLRLLANKLHRSIFMVTIIVTKGAWTMTCVIIRNSHKITALFYTCMVSILHHTYIPIWNLSYINVQGIPTSLSSLTVGFRKQTNKSEGCSYQLHTSEWSDTIIEEAAIPETLFQKVVFYKREDAHMYSALFMLLVSFAISQVMSSATHVIVSCNAEKLACWIVTTGEFQFILTC